MAVYPRSRGEHWKTISTDVKTSGLSPLSRGTLGILVLTPKLHRFIPALAGNTLLRPGSRYARAVYPRSRGEHICGMTFRQRINGLSPLSRGTQY